MKHVTKVQTKDGALHNSPSDARRYAEKLYGEALSRLAHNLVQIEKYLAMQEFVDQNLEVFAELKALKADIAMEPGDEEE